MTSTAVNPERVYHNFRGALPSVQPEAEPAPLPTRAEDDQPKMITDTTMRDGAQDSRFPLFPQEAKLRFYDLLHQLDNGSGTIGTVEVFIYQERDQHILHKLLDRGYEFPQVTTWTRANPKDIKLLLDVGKGRVKETGMLASASDHHIFDKMGFHSKEEAVEKYLQPILTAYEAGITPRVHLEDCTKADIYGWVIPFINRVLDETGGSAKFRVCDTLGWGVPDPYAPLPWGVPRLISTIRRETGAELEFHGQDDFGLAAINSITALRYGAKKANCTIAGIGERSGNTSMEQTLAGLIRYWGDPGVDLTAFEEMRNMIHAEVTPLSDRLPLIGEVFTTQAGIHQSGVAREGEAPGGHIYQPFSPHLFGKTEVELHRIGGLAGMDGIVAVLNAASYEAGEEKRYTAASKTVKRIYDHVHASYDGTWDETSKSYKGERREFYSPEEIVALAREFERKG
jgi:isopropylmalate/homocitrate/citramalate synthase